MKLKLICAMALLSLAVGANAQRKQSFETGWKFHRNGVINAETTACDDSKWREVTLPHDFSVEVPIDIKEG